MKMSILRALDIKCEVITMYEELVKSLRAQADYYCCHMGINSPPAMMFIEAADAIEDLSKTLDEEVEINTALECNMPVWIPVTERLPENEEQVLVVRKFLGVRTCPPQTYVEIAEYCYGDWVSYSDEYKIARSKHTDPLFWMPLPKLQDQTFGNDSDNCQKSKEGE